MGWTWRLVLEAYKVEEWTSIGLFNFVSKFQHIFYFRNQPASGFGFIIMSKYGNPLFQLFNIFIIKRTSGFGFSKIWKELSALIKELTVQGRFFHPVLGSIVAKGLYRSAPCCIIQSRRWISHMVYISFNNRWILL